MKVPNTPYLGPFSEQNTHAMLREETASNRRVCRLLGLCPECAEDLCASFARDRPAVYKCMNCDWEEQIVRKK